MKRLSNQDILKVIEKDFYAKKSFLGVFPRDMLPRITIYPSSFIVNTHPMDQRGEHWLALFVDKNKKCEFFDSFGFSEKDYGFENYIRTFSRNYTSNKNQIQHLDSNACGYYCIYFILLKARGFKMSDINNLFSIVDFNLNDFLVSHVVV